MVHLGWSDGTVIFKDQSLCGFIEKSNHVMNMDKHISELCSVDKIISDGLIGMQIFFEDFLRL